MDPQLIGMCGAYCGACAWKEPTNCPGCLASRSQMFWGTCAVARCALERDLPHCGFCADLPCARLQSFFDDPEHGDNGERLANLQAWARGETTFTPLTKKRPASD
ncbi:MAG: hypothetical protein BWY25_02168 [Chloroflexi bacterium ADurb.Bin222]|nr:MAG: hypothetical protein BWY25_02168 [Chloroflexi bacterium ADurb.Bin222]